jgi:hypothetical protein
MMNKNKMIFALAGFVIVAAMAIPALADPPQEGECPPGWGDPIRVNKAIDKDRAKEEDADGDKWIRQNASPPVPQYVDNEK